MIAEFIDPVQFVCTALQLAPVGEPSDEQFRCHITGRIYPAGTCRVPAKRILGSSFQDRPALAVDYGQGSAWASGYVAALFPKSVIAKLSGSLVLPDRVLSISKIAQRKYIFSREHLPPPPFLVLGASGVNAQHLAWRTPVTYSRDFVTVRIGPQHIYTADMQKVWALVDKAQPNAPCMMQVVSPFMAEDGIGEPSRSLMAASPDAVCADKPYAHSDYRSLNPAEWWMIYALMNRAAPVTPPSVFQS